MPKEEWPELRLDAWRGTKDTLHMWTQVVGKVRLARTPLVNHYWNVPLYVTARGLSTSLIPSEPWPFEMEFDFHDHELVIRRADGAREAVALRPRTVADFYADVMAKLDALGLATKIWTTPVEVESPIPFDSDLTHAEYDAEQVERFYRTLLIAHGALAAFRARFVGKVSPVHFFWGSFDLAVTRFSGRRAPERPEADPVTREAYSHEVISHGYWPGSGDVPEAAFYSYTAPAPAGLAESRVRPERAYWNPGTSGFILRYGDARSSEDPWRAIDDFLESTYEAGATLANWDRAALERPS